jgi:hypothetical protein
VTLGHIFFRMLLLSPVSVIPTQFRVLLHRHVAVTKRRNGQSYETSNNEIFLRTSESTWNIYFLRLEKVRPIPSVAPLTVCSRSARGLLTVRSRSAHGLLTVRSRASYRPAHGLLTDSPRSAHGPLTVCSRSAHGLITVCSRSAHSPLTDFLATCSRPSHGQPTVC